MRQLLKVLKVRLVGVEQTNEVKAHNVPRDNVQ